MLLFFPGLEFWSVMLLFFPSLGILECDVIVLSIAYFLRECSCGVQVIIHLGCLQRIDKVVNNNGMANLKLMLASCNCCIFIPSASCVGKDDQLLFNSFIV
jgi:hypothetical protein